LRPRGRNHERRAVSFTTTSLPEDGWTTTMLAPSTKSCVQKQLSGIDGVEKLEYGLGDHALLLSLLLLLRELSALAPAAVVVVARVALLAALVDSRLKRGRLSGIVEIGVANLPVGSLEVFGLRVRCR
jgi:hypothetical protein